MIELGKKQTLLVVKFVEFGVYLADFLTGDWKKIFCFHIMSRQLVSLRGRNVW